MVRFPYSFLGVFLSDSGSIYSEHVLFYIKKRYLVLKSFFILLFCFSIHNIMCVSSEVLNGVCVFANAYRGWISKDNKCENKLLSSVLRSQWNAQKEKKTRREMTKYFFKNVCAVSVPLAKAEYRINITDIKWNDSRIRSGMRNWELRRVETTKKILNVR